MLKYSVLSLITCIQLLNIIKFDVLKIVKIDIVIKNASEVSDGVTNY